jgi:sugar lactone lactonase YvrE
MPPSDTGSRRPQRTGRRPLAGLPLNSPNDVIVLRDGSIWFTDPSYGHRQGFRPRPVLGDRVYRLERRTGELWSATPSSVCRSDADLQVQRHFDINEYTDTHHD